MRGSIRIIVAVIAGALVLLAPAAGQGGPGWSLDWSPATNGAFDYGEVAAGQTVSQDFTLSVGKATVKGIDVSLSGSSAFKLTVDSCSGDRTHLKANKGETCTVTVAYSPVSASDSATLSAMSDKHDASGSITLTGSGALTFTAIGGLSPLNENPPHPTSSATGTAVVTWDTTTSMMTVAVSFTGLTSNSSAAHIHCCIAPPGNTGVATVPPAFPGFPLGVTSGTYSHTLNMLDAASYNTPFITANGGTPATAAAALLAGLEAGHAYLNIHTVNFPGGEIRGFLTH